MSVLHITDPVVFDDTIASREYHTYLPYASTSYNNDDEIRIPIFNQDSYTVPSESFLLLEGNILRTPPAASLDNNTRIVVNGFAHLFSDIRYELNGIVIDQTKNPGIATSMKLWCSIPYEKSQLHGADGWNNDKVLVRDSGKFQVEIPLKHLLGFAEDYKKIILNIKQELVLFRAHTDRNVWVAGPADKNRLSMNLTKVAWRIPHITVSDVARVELLKILEKDPWIEMGFMNWELHEYPLLPTTTSHTWTVKSSTKLETPRFILLAFQTGRKNDDDKNASKFDHCTISSMKLYLNGIQFPYDNIAADFSNNRYVRLYHMFSYFAQAYYNRDQGSVISYDNFKAICPIVAIDCSNQNEVLKSGAVDVRIEWETKDDVAADTTAYCLILHDRVVRYRPLSSLVHTM